MTRLEKAQQRVDELNDDVRVLRAQIGRHRSHTEETELLRIEVSKTLSERSKALRELHFSRRIAP